MDIGGSAGSFEYAGAADDLFLVEGRDDLGDAEWGSDSVDGVW